MAAPKKTLFIPIPGTVTGDLWHLAAAQILSLEYINDWELVTVVVMTERGDPNEIPFGRATFNYLRDLKLPCMVMKISGLPEKASKKLIELAIYDMVDSLQETWQVKKHSKGDFDEELRNSVTYKANGVTESNLVLPFKRAIPKEDSPVLQLMAATTIAIQILCSKAEHLQVRRNFLSERMVPQRDAAIYEQANELADQKWEQLKQLINDKHKRLINDKHNPSIASVLLYLNRKNPHANINTDSSEEIQSQMEEIARERNMIFQVVAVGAEPKDDDFDIFNKRGREPYPGLNPCATAILWRKVKQAATFDGAQQLGLQVPVFGVFGGRTGSIDLPAFCGVNCFFWDEPWLQATRNTQIYEEFAKLSMFKDNPVELSKAMDGQISQCLRSLQLYPIMATGLVEEIVDIKNEFPLPSSRTWKKVKSQELDQWLNGSNVGSIFPEPPPGADWNAPEKFSFYRKSYLERKTDRIEATVLDCAGYK